jgi:hypothetical protein
MAESHIAHVATSLHTAYQWFHQNVSEPCAAVALYVMHYNFCRVHEALRVTPAMQLGVRDHVWTVSELVEAALKAAPMPPPPLERR